MRARLLTLTISCFGVAPAAAQWTDLDRRLRSIEQGYEDLSPQAESFRMFPVDLRTPYGFEGLYEIVDAPGLLARRSGAVTAVFERSVYHDDASAAIPPGTVFYVGDLPVDLSGPGVLSGGEAEEVGAPWNFVDSSAAGVVDGRVFGQRLDLRVPQDGAAVDEPLAPSAAIWSGESARRRRIGEILRGVAWRVREAAAEGASTPLADTPAPAEDQNAPADGEGPSESQDGEREADEASSAP